MALPPFQYDFICDTTLETGVISQGHWNKIELKSRYHWRYNCDFRCYIWLEFADPRLKPYEASLFDRWQILNTDLRRMIDIRPHKPRCEESNYASGGGGGGGGSLKKSSVSYEMCINRNCDQVNRCDFSWTECESLQTASMAIDLQINCLSSQFPYAPDDKWKPKLGAEFRIDIITCRVSDSQLLDRSQFYLRVYSFSELTQRFPSHPGKNCAVFKRARLNDDFLDGPNIRNPPISSDELSRLTAADSDQPMKRTPIIDQRPLFCSIVDEHLLRSENENGFQKRCRLVVLINAPTKRNIELGDSLRTDLTIGRWYRMNLWRAFGVLPADRFRISMELVKVSYDSVERKWNRDKSAYRFDSPQSTDVEPSIQFRVNQNLSSGQDKIDEIVSNSSGSVVSFRWKIAPTRREYRNQGCFEFCLYPLNNDRGGSFVARNSPKTYRLIVEVCHEQALSSITLVSSVVQLVPKNKNDENFYNDDYDLDVDIVRYPIYPQTVLTEHESQ